VDIHRSTADQAKRLIGKLPTEHAELGLGNAIMIEVGEYAGAPIPNDPAIALVAVTIIVLLMVALFKDAKSLLKPLASFFVVVHNSDLCGKRLLVVKFA